MATLAANPKTKTFRLPAPFHFLVPSFADLLFVCIIFWSLFITTQSTYNFMGDANMGLHIRTGDIVLQTHGVPSTDPYSFSRPQGEWYAFEWLTCLIYALLHQAVGLNAVVGASAVLLGLYPVLMLRASLDRGAALLVAFPIALLGYQGASIHYLARPHLFTMILFVITVWAVERDRQNPTKWTYLLVPMGIVWTNLHGGFLTLPVYLGLVAAGYFLERWWQRKPELMTAARRYFGLSVLCGLASLVNPYGLKLHAHIYQFLGSRWLTEMVQEYAPAWTFTFDRMGVYYGMVAAAVLVSMWLLWREKRVVEPLILLFFIYASMKSARHITLFMVVAVPILALELTRVWRHGADKAGPRSILKLLDQVFADLTPAFHRFSIWLPIVALALTLDAGRWFPTQFPHDGREDYPLAMIQRHQTFLRGSRLFTTDHWADFLVYRDFPNQKIFVDGRSDYFGQQIGYEYLTMLETDPGWQPLWRKWNFDAALMPTKMKLTRALEQDPDWRVVDRTEAALLFVRTTPTR